ncbi:MAG TPA: sigma-70 family RNA polymerase sigma factor [Gemmataceae bacterium]|nr:sigma-70 family RNA polymerase sigma factor [Gemmataceae bacterium]
MASPQTSTILHYLRQTVLRHDGAGLSDGQLLRSFLYRGDEAAFEALVRRHGPMVRGVCRRVLRNLDDADDAFQAVFLVLLRKASTLATREILGDWLHGVAYRTALKARSAAARRRMKEKQALRSEAIYDEEDRSEWLPLLDEEVGRLPQKYRLPVVLCDLEGRTRKEAAQQLGWPEGTLSGRLSRARAMLARRLTRRGVTLSVAALAMGLSGEASAHLPFSLISSVCKSAMEFAAGSATGSIPVHIAALTEGVVKAMFLSKLKNAVALATIAVVLTAGAGTWRYAAVAGQAEKQAEEKPVPAARNVRPAAVPKPPMSVPKDEAVKIDLRKGRRFQIDLRIEREKDGQRTLVVSPRLLAPEGTPASVAHGMKAPPINIGSGKMEVIDLGTMVQLVVRSEARGKVRLDMTVTRSGPITIGQDVELKTRIVRFLRTAELGQPITATVTGDKDSSPLYVTAAVQEVARETDPKVEKETDPNTNAAAEKEFKAAELYRRMGMHESARLCYRQIRLRYPGTIYAERAKKRLAVEILPARVGQIFVIGNKKISDEDILEEVNLFPGQNLTEDLRHSAERRLAARLDGLKSNPKITVIDREGDGEFKDLRITVEEK